MSKLLPFLWCFTLAVPIHHKVLPGVACFDQDYLVNGAAVRVVHGVAVPVCQVRGHIDTLPTGHIVPVVDECDRRAVRNTLLLVAH